MSTSIKELNLWYFKRQAIQQGRLHSIKQLNL